MRQTADAECSIERNVNEITAPEARKIRVCEWIVIGIEGSDTDAVEKNN